MIAGDLVQTDAPTLSLDDTIADAAEVLTSYRHSNLPVVDEEGRLVGALGEEDILALALPTSAAELDRLSYLPRCYGLRNLEDEELRETPVADVMRREGLVTVEEDELAAQAALLIIRHHQPQIFVVRAGRLVGRLCRKDIISQVVNPTLGVACHP
ncbi:MAG: CBS domain-containing protein [Armatimonadota bacterium]